MDGLLSWIAFAAACLVALLGGLCLARVRRVERSGARSLADLLVVAEVGVVVAVDKHPDGGEALVSRDLETGAVRARIALRGRAGEHAPLRVLGAVADRLWCGQDELGLHLRSAVSLEVLETQGAVCARNGVTAPLASWRNAQATLLDTGEVRLLGTNGRRVSLRPGVEGPVSRPDTWRPTRWSLDTADDVLSAPRFQAGTDAESVEEAMVAFEERRREQAETRLAVAAGFCLPVRFEPDLPDGSLLACHQLSVDDKRLVLACLTPQAVRWTTSLGVAGEVQIAASGGWVVGLVTPHDPGAPELFGVRASSGEVAWRARL